MSRTNETGSVNVSVNVSVNLDQMQLFVIINNIGIKINVDVTVKN